MFTYIRNKIASVRDTVVDNIVRALYDSMYDQAPNNAKLSMIMYGKALRSLIRHKVLEQTKDKSLIGILGMPITVVVKPEELEEEYELMFSE